jgi:hypothetical protein
MADGELCGGVCCGAGISLRGACNRAAPWDAGVLALGVGTRTLYLLVVAAGGGQRAQCSEQGAPAQLTMVMARCASLSCRVLGCLHSCVLGAVYD